MPRAAHRFVRFIVILLCAISLSANGEPATREGLITNQYVRVSRVELAAHDSFSLPKNGHFHILISGSTRSVSVARSDNREPVAASQNLWTLDEARSYQISNCGEVQLSVTLLDVLTSPGRIICSNGNACPWSIRSLDPVPVFLSDHLTIFRIPLPWRPEARSVIVPSVEVSVSDVHHDAWDALWMDTLEEVKPARPKEPWRFSIPEGAVHEPWPYMLEIAFYERPFCFCKRVRRDN